MKGPLENGTLKSVPECGEKETALMPALYTAQKEHGWMSIEAMEAVAGALDIPKARVKGFATFYDMFGKKPVGRHVVRLCTNVSCILSGSEELLLRLRDKFGIAPDETTPDGRFSLVAMECIGACGTAPAMLVDNDFYEDLTTENIFSILEKYK
ncbi:MAG: NADH-quinone oxidoreductase subunit NuoE [Nitrospirae bacterium]|nr:MAG: NADH-quinone oxidoreductase subunit NuoE [Nitrospirota bacterium]